MEKRADEIIQEQHRPAAIAVNEETAGRIADEGRDRLDEQKTENLPELETALNQNLRQHENDAVRCPQKTERDDPQQDRPPAPLRRQQLEHRHAAFLNTGWNDRRRRQRFSFRRFRLDIGHCPFGFSDAPAADQVADRLPA